MRELGPDLYSKFRRAQTRSDHKNKCALVLPFVVNNKGLFLNPVQAPKRTSQYQYSSNSKTNQLFQVFIITATQKDFSFLL